MAGGGIVYGGLIFLPEAVLAGGQYGDKVGQSPYQMASYRGVTGGTNASPVDITWNQAANVKLITSVPYNKRLRFSRLKFSLHGATPWLGGGFTLQDDAGNPAAYVPVTALTIPGQTLVFPVSDVPGSFLATAASYNTGTGAVTFPASTFVNATLVGVPFQIIDGTGKGQAGFISTVTTTVMTPTNAAATFPIAPDSTSVFSFSYLQATAGAATTITASNAGLATNALAQGYYVVIVAGTGAGQVRAVTSNTATAITVPTWTTTPDTTSIFQITKKPELMGAVDLACGNSWACMGVGKGLQVALNGTPSAGSPVRIEWDIVATL